jgi:hypothetical protein
MLFLVNLLLAFLAGILTLWAFRALTSDPDARRAGVIVAIIVGLLVFLANLGDQVV